MTINAVLDGAHDGVNGVSVRLVAVNPYVTTLPATVQSPTGTVSVLVLQVPAGLTLVGPSSFDIALERGRDTIYTIHSPQRERRVREPWLPAVIRAHALR
ncbi:hypothetical protein [Gordonia sputi]|uniref:hypothetical protein n=1 Tax=Gordonia sputi TaxID=36823 RepID=UPI00226F6028|nr:hypothetical protein [Gordonia sputi]